MTDPTPLSPAAQALLVAYWKAEEQSQQHGLAAALRVAAVYSYCPMDRQRLAAIAAELEGIDG